MNQHTRLNSGFSKSAKPFIQPALKVGGINDKYEQQADHIADQVMKGSLLRNNAIPSHNKSLQRKCSECEEEELQLKPLADRISPLIQPKSENPGSIISGPLLQNIQSAKGTGQSMDPATKESMESSFGSDFSNINIHTNSRANNLNQQLQARAFTVGNDIFFNKGEYRPNSKNGKHLLAHELTHTIQQGPRNSVQRTPNPNPPPAAYTPGRPAHNHPARGVWSTVQANARAYCISHTSVNQIGPFPVPIPPTDNRGKSECACAAMTPLQVLNTAKAVQMSGKPLAQAHLQHYISGGGADYVEHANLDNMLVNDSGVRSVLASAISAADRGNVFVQQSDYANQDYRFAFGGIDRVDYLVDRSAGTVDVWFKDRYDFHPAGFGYMNKGTGDTAPPGRPSNCVHAAAVEAKLSGAADFWMYGHVTVPLSLFSTSSLPSGSSDL